MGEASGTRSRRRPGTSEGGWRCTSWRGCATAPTPFAIAGRLEWPLDVAVVSKNTFPWNSEVDDGLASGFTMRVAIEAVRGAEAVELLAAAREGG